jgi:hypothetical protein
MFLTTMRTALLQATALCTISMMLDHHTSSSVFDAVWENEGFITVFNAINSSIPNVNNTSIGQLALDAGENSNTTTTFDQSPGFLNATTLGFLDLPSEAFYSHKLPREVFIFLVISALQYWWHIFLERILPGRPRPKAVLSEKQADHSEGREEEVVQRWIAQGRVQRSSLSWCNTILKWVVEMTVGRLWYHTVEHGIRVMLKPEDPRLPISGLKHVSYYFRLPSRSVGRRTIS